MRAFPGWIQSPPDPPAFHIVGLGFPPSSESETHETVTARLRRSGKTLMCFQEGSLFARQRTPDEKVSYLQPTSQNPLHHRDDLVDWPRAMESEFPFPGNLISAFVMS